VEKYKGEKGHRRGAELRGKKKLIDSVDPGIDRSLFVKKRSISTKKGKKLFLAREGGKNGEETGKEEKGGTPLDRSRWEEPPHAFQGVRGGKLTAAEGGAHQCSAGGSAILPSGLRSAEGREQPLPG